MSAAMAARELFVWYRVRPEHVAEARREVLGLQQALRVEWPGLQARLLARDGAETSTWMETYSRPGSDDGVVAAIEAAIVAAAAPLEALIDGGRHVEAFAVAE